MNGNINIPGGGKTGGENIWAKFEWIPEIVLPKVDATLQFSCASALSTGNITIAIASDAVTDWNEITAETFAGHVLYSGSYKALSSITITNVALSSDSKITITYKYSVTTRTATGTYSYDPATHSIVTSGWSGTDTYKVWQYLDNLTYTDLVISITPVEVAHLGDLIQYIASDNPDEFEDGITADGSFYYKKLVNIFATGLLVSELDEEGYPTGTAKIQMPIIPSKCFQMGLPYLTYNLDELDIITTAIGDNAFFQFFCEDNLKKTKVKVRASSIGINAFYGVPDSGAGYMFWIAKNCTTIAGSSYKESPFYYSDSTIELYCEHDSAPAGFESYWNNYSVSARLTVMYGVTEEAFDAL